ncbi:MAG: C39 family peptidase [Candidatus Thermoplasmatota archaeon]|nr:C39 family peptidase [Candidatus Thermoplasmatota archaeon]
MKNKFFYVIVIVISFIKTSFADLNLVINILPQEHTLTCWASVCRMVLAAYGITKTETQVMTYATSGANVTNQLYGSDFSCDGILKYFGTQASVSISSAGRSNAMSFSEIVTQINDNRPIIILRSKADMSSHMLLITGYRYNPERIIYNDPEPVNTGRQAQEMLYTTMVRDPANVTIYCRNTLRITDNPPQPIPTPVNPPPSYWVAVDYNGTFEIAPTTTVLNYPCTRSFSNSATWTCDVKFLTSDGYQSVKSWSTLNTTAQYVTWSTNNFSMSQGYPWLYSLDGKLHGKVETVVTYSGNTVQHCRSVTFTPSNLYPGCLLYKDKIISSNQADVKAHEELTLINDTFNSGTVNFKSGDQINIENGVTINNGSVDNFTIDQSVW